MLSIVTRGGEESGQLYRYPAIDGWRAMRGVMRRVSALLSLATLLATPACASTSYMGISMLPDDAATEVQALARRAQAGDKQAQLDFGIRFEEGNGVPRDTKRAMKLYRMAATDSGGRIWVYAPSPGNGAPARVMPVDKGPRQPGLEEAKRRLNATKEETHP